MMAKHFKPRALVLGAAAALIAGAATTGLVASSRAADAPAPSAGKTLYTCPMHPQVIEDKPGTCPICGMDLVPKRPAPQTSGAPAAKSATPEPGRKIKYWVAPMDPTYISDKPGKSPMGMDLVPVYEDEATSAPTARAGEVVIDPVVVQDMGVRIAEVRRGSISRAVRTIGTVDVAENLLSVVNLRYSGWIERIYVDATGSYVKKGAPLFDIYSPELVSAQDEYLTALRTAGSEAAITKSARARLDYWQLGATEIQRIEREARPVRAVTVTAPQSGYVLHKNVVQGARVNAGSDLYRIGNLTTIWVNAEVYEFDAPWVELGAKARMELTFERGKTYEGKVSYIYPTLNEKTRTLSVRLEFQNPGLALKPGMFATVQIEVQRKDDVTLVPTEAIIHSGTRQLVFVATSLGHYAMREVTTGVVGERYVTEVLSGVNPGERVVTSGQFLLDSESQLQEAVQKMLEARLESQAPTATSPSESAPAAPTTAGPTSTNDQDKSYWTCGMHPQIVQDHPGTCPICGMDLVEKKK